MTLETLNKRNPENGLDNLTISEYIFTFFVETASFEIVFPKGGCFVA